MDLETATIDKLKDWEASLAVEYDTFKAQRLDLDLTRGKPSAEQLKLSDGIDDILNAHFTSASGVDCRNYGGIEGIIEARALGASILGVPAENVIAGGNSSLTLMHQAVLFANFFGLNGPDSAWNKEDAVKFICPVPGYDRHFSVCEHLGIEMIATPMTPDGPDMDVIEQKVAEDSSIKGMWCVPKYSNPTGITYSEATVRRIAALAKFAGAHFRVFWDNAYAIHDLVDSPKPLANIFDFCQEAGTEDSIIQFASTSKVTHAGSGVAFMAASDANLAGFKKSLAFTTIGPDKVNQLRHTVFFARPGSLQEHMKAHAKIIAPRFACVLAHLEKAFGKCGLGKWESPEGGYFVSFDAIPGVAKEITRLAGEAGVKLTPAGATFPYGNDPQDSNIRIAPTVPTVEQVDEAMKVFTVCVKLASVRKELGQRELV